jgi:hypothetical protein
LPLTASFPGKTACKPPVRISALIARFIVAHIVKEAKRSPSQIVVVLCCFISAVIEPSDEGVRFLHFWGKHFEDYNGLGNGCLLIGLSQKYGKPTLRPSETMSVNRCAFVGTNPKDEPITSGLPVIRSESPDISQFDRRNRPAVIANVRCPAPDCTACKNDKDRGSAQSGAAWSRSVRSWASTELLAVRGKDPSESARTRPR